MHGFQSGQLRNSTKSMRGLKGKYPEVKVLISSGRISDEKMHTHSAAGASVFITKPCTLESLSKIVADVIASV